MNGYVRNAFRLGALWLVTAGCNEVLGLDPGTPTTGGNAGEPMAGTGAGGITGGTASGTSASGGASAGTGATSGGAGATGQGGAGRGGSDSGGGGTGGRGTCARSRDCVEQGFDWPGICRSGRCIDITTDDCNFVMGAENLSTETEPVMETEPVIFGALVADVDPANIGRSVTYWNFRLAMEEFFRNNDNQGGIPIGDVNRRPLLILCHDTFEPGGWLVRSLDHLIENVGVPGIVTVTRPHELTIAAALAFRKDQDVFFLSHTGADTNLANLEDRGRVWHMLGTELDVAPTYVPLVERIEARVNPVGIANGRPTRLVMIESEGDFFYGARLRIPLNETLRINGAPASAQLDVNYFVVSTGGTDLYELSEIVGELGPDIIVDLSGMYQVPYYIDAVARRRGSPLPFYVEPGLLAHGSDLPYLIYLDPSLRTRVVGVNTAAGADTRMYDAYLGRVQLLTPSAMDENIRSTENLYDQIYYLFYAAAAAGTDGTLNGTKLGAAMKRLVSGDPYYIGPDQISGIFRLLTDESEPESSIGFHATMGAPNFDERMGTRVLDGSVYCVREDLTLAYDVLLYDRTTKSLSGTFPCFDF